jgi:hypothetical protein
MTTDITRHHTHVPPAIDPVRGLPNYRLYAARGTFTVPIQTLSTDERVDLGVGQRDANADTINARVVIFDKRTLFPLATILSAPNGTHYIRILTYDGFQYFESVAGSAIGYGSFGVAYKELFSRLEDVTRDDFRDDRPFLHLDPHAEDVASSMHRSTCSPCPNCNEPSEIVTARLGRSQHLGTASRPVITLRLHTDAMWSRDTHPFVCTNTFDSNEDPNVIIIDHGNNKPMPYCAHCRNAVVEAPHLAPNRWIHADTGWRACSYYGTGGTP